MDEPLTFEKLLDMAARNGAGPGHDTEEEEEGMPKPDTRRLHQHAAAAYAAWAHGMDIRRVWDELDTYEQVAWRDVVRTVAAELRSDDAETGDRPMFAVTVDAVLIYGDHVAMIRRGKEPFKGHLALIGGHVELDETTSYAAQRELHEEVGVLLGPECFTQVPGIWDAVDRNPLRRTVGVTYLVRVPFGQRRPVLVAGDDADEAEWVRIDAVLSAVVPVAFDHRQMLGAVTRFAAQRSRHS